MATFYRLTQKKLPLLVQICPSMRTYTVAARARAAHFANYAHAGGWVGTDDRKREVSIPATTTHPTL